MASCALAQVPSRSITRLQPSQAASGTSLEHERVALVVGNSAYAGAAYLPNPVNDAQAVAKALQEAGFLVYLVENADKARMDQAVKKFQSKMNQAEFVAFFYAGHGVQIGGQNYLIPTGSEIKTEAEALQHSFGVNDLLTAMDSADAPINWVILDACRNNPLLKQGSVPQGLAKMSAPSGIQILTSTRPGEVASDGSGSHSPFTKELVPLLKQPGLELSQLPGHLKPRVEQATRGKQTPWAEGILPPNVYLNPGVVGKGSASVSHQCLDHEKPHCPDTFELQRRAIEVAKIHALKDLSVKHGIGLESLIAVQMGRLKGETLTSKSGAKFKGIEWSDPQIDSKGATVKVRALVVHPNTID